ncbi:MAG: hypothetical protein ACRCUK_06670, partial [Plesiomonas shigelloides]
IYCVGPDTTISAVPQAALISFPVFPAVPRLLSGFFVSVAGDYCYAPHGVVFILSYLLSLVPLLIGFGRCCAVLFSA